MLSAGAAGGELSLKTPAANLLGAAGISRTEPPASLRARPVPLPRLISTLPPPPRRNTGRDLRLRPGSSPVPPHLCAGASGGRGAASRAPRPLQQKGAGGRLGGRAGGGPGRAELSGALCRSVRPSVGRSVRLSGRRARPVLSAARRVLKGGRPAPAGSGSAPATRPRAPARHHFAPGRGGAGALAGLPRAPSGSAVLFFSPSFIIVFRFFFSSGT